MFVTARLISAPFDAPKEINHEIHKRNRNQSDLVSLQKVKDFHNISEYFSGHVCSTE